jgi:hypothetical protein
VPLHCQLAPAALQAVVQLIQVRFRLGDLTIKARDRGAFDLAVDELGELKVLAVDQDVERDLDVSSSNAEVPTSRLVKSFFTTPVSGSGKVTSASLVRRR